MRTIETILAGGADQLAAERQDTDWGAAKEAAVLAALRLIRTAFTLDTAVVAALRQTELSGAAALSLSHCCLWCAVYQDTKVLCIVRAIVAIKTAILP